MSDSIFFLTTGSQLKWNVNALVPCPEAKVVDQVRRNHTIARATRAGCL
jgi:hypothetical protein